MSDKSLGIPDLMDVESIQEKQEAEKKVRAFVEQVNGKMDVYLEQAWFCLGGDEIRRSTFLKEFKEIEKAVQMAMAAKHPVAQIAAAEAYALSLIRKAPATRAAIVAALAGPMLVNGHCLPGLVVNGFLVERTEEEIKTDSPNNVFIRLYGKSYRVEGSESFRKQLTLLLNEKVSAAEKAASDQLMEQIRSIFAQSTPGISLAAIAKGMPGRMGLSVPDDFSGGVRHFGGVMLVESDGKHLKILEGVGKFAGKVNQLKELRRFLPVYSLNSERLVLRDQVSQPVYKDLWLFHTLLRRVVEDDRQRSERLKKSEDFKKACEQERTDLVAKTTVQFIPWLLEKVSGSTVISLPHWEMDHQLEGGKKRTEKFSYVSFLAERAEDGKIRIAEFPERLKSLFQNPKLSELTDPGDRFSALAYPLSAMLRMAFGKAVNANRVSASKKSDPAAEASIVEPAESQDSTEAQ